MSFNGGGVVVVVVVVCMAGCRLARRATPQEGGGCPGKVAHRRAGTPEFPEMERVR